MARPTIKPEKMAKIVDGIRLGLSIKRACAWAKVNRSTYYAWRERGEKEGSGQFRDFLDATEHALAERCVALLTELHSIAVNGETGRGQVKAATWLLEKFDVAAYGHAIKVEQDVVVRSADERRDLLAEGLGVGRVTPPTKTLH